MTRTLVRASAIHSPSFALRVVKSQEMRRKATMQCKPLAVVAFVAFAQVLFIYLLIPPFFLLALTVLNQKNVDTFDGLHPF